MKKPLLLLLLIGMISLGSCKKSLVCNCTRTTVSLGSTVYENYTIETVSTKEKALEGVCASYIQDNLTNNVYVNCKIN